MNDGFTKLFSSIITSSIWREDDKTRIMWITMLAMCDEDGFVSGSIPGMAGVAAMSIPEAKQAIDRLSSPDEYSRSKEQDGRRIMPFVGGWMIVNYKTYRSQARIEDRKLYMKTLMKQRRALARSANEVLTGANPSASASASDINKEEGGMGEETDFDVFWKAYPRKVGKLDARTAWTKTANQRPPLKDILSSIETQKKSEQWTKECGQFIPYPARWLRNGRWSDQPVTVTTPAIISRLT